MAADSAAPGAGRWLVRAGYAAALAAYLVAAAYLVRFCQDTINPDGVAYLQAARHYAEGRLGLAVNGWFGPMMSWLIVPAYWLGADPVLWARWLGVLSGVLFAFGVVRLTKRMGGGRYSLPAFAAALLLALRTVFAELTPDFLLATGLTWFFAFCADLLPAPSWQKALRAGVVGGACCLVKAYALPVVLVTLAMTALLRWLLVRWYAKPAVMEERDETIAGQSPPIKTFAVAAGAAILVAAPWIAIISAQFGRFTLNTSSSLSGRSWLKPERLSGVPRVYPPYSSPERLIQRPREGRITVWENPAEAKGDWPTWPEADLAQKWKWQWQTITYNFDETVSFLGKVDVLYLLPLATILGVLLAAFWRRPAPAVLMAWLWGALSAAIYLGGYLLLYLYERFTWGAWGAMLAVFAGVLAALGDPPQPAAAPKGARKKSAGLPATAPSQWTPGRIGGIALFLVLLGSSGYGLAMRIGGESQPKSECSLGRWIRRDLTTDFRQKGQHFQVVSNDWGLGLYFSYWTDSVFLGQFPSHETTRLDPGRELRPGPTLILVCNDPFNPQYQPAVVDSLSRSPGFRVVEEKKGAGRDVVILRYDPNEASAARSEGTR